VEVVPGAGRGRRCDTHVEADHCPGGGAFNAEVAALMYLSINTIKSYIRSAYRKIGAANRTQAVLWGVEHGFQPDYHRIDHWRGGP